MLNKVKSPNIYKLHTYFLFTFIVIGLIAILATSLNIRPYVDDFYYLKPDSWNEFISYLERRYAWTGRYTTTTVFIFFGLTSAWIFTPLLSITILFISFVLIYKYFIENIITKFSTEIVSLSVLLSLSSVMFILLTIPHPYSSFFWASSAPIHTWSYGLMIFLFYVFIKNNKIKSKKIEKTLTICFFIVGLMSELATVLATIGMFAILLFYYSKGKNIKHVIYCVSTLLLSASILIFSPGALNRKEAVGFNFKIHNLIDLPQAISINMRQLLEYTNNFILILVLFFIAAASSFIITRRHKIFDSEKIKKILLWNILITLFVSIISPSLMYVSTGYFDLLSRGQVPLFITLTTLVVVAGFFVGVVIDNKFVGSFKYISILLVLGTYYIGIYTSFKFIVSFHRDIEQRRIIFDNRQRIVEEFKKMSDSHANCVLTLKATDLMYTQEGVDLTNNPQHWINTGFKMYYELDKCSVVSN